MVVQTIQNNLKNGHKWTEEELDLIRVEYKGTIKSAEIIAKRLSNITGENITAGAVMQKVYRVGFPNKMYKRWTDKEEEYFAELVGKFPICEIHRRMKHNGYNRSLQSIKCKIKALKLSTQDRIGWYTKEETARILGVNPKTVQVWIDCKSLKASWHHGKQPSGNIGRAYWHIDEADLLDFALNHSMELTGRNINFFLISDMFKARLNQK